MSGLPKNLWPPTDAGCEYIRLFGLDFLFVFFKLDQTNFSFVYITMLCTGGGPHADTSSQYVDGDLMYRSQYPDPFA